MGSAAVVSPSAPRWIHVFHYHWDLRRLKNTSLCHLVALTSGFIGQIGVPLAAAMLLMLHQKQYHRDTLELRKVDWVALGFKFVKKKKKRKYKLSRTCPNTMKTTRLTFWSGGKKKKTGTPGRSNMSCEPGGQSWLNLSIKQTCSHLSNITRPSGHREQGGRLQNAFSQWVFRGSTL